MSELEKQEMISYIEEYGTEYVCDSDEDCKNCDDVESCYWRVNNKINSTYAESIGYGGYDTEDEFWEDLFD